MNGWQPGAGPTLAEAGDRLATEPLDIVGRLPWSSNATFLVTVGAGEDGGADGGPDPDADGGEGADPPPLQAVYKPERGEQQLWDFPDGLYRREVAAYALSEALGWGLVPPTVEREEGPFGPGSLQLFVAVDYARHYFTLFDEGGHDETLYAVAAFDVAANNADRKSGHVLAGTDGRLWAIDHGLCFHPQPKLRTVVWDYAGEPVPGPLLDDLARVAADLPDSVGRLLSDVERAMVAERIDHLVERGTYPEPTGDRPPYPWPLV